MKVTYFPQLSAVTFLLAIFLFIPFENAYAMHIMEGYLPLSWSIFWSVIALPFIIWGIAIVRRNADSSQKYLILLAMCGAFAFVLSALKLPSVTGSCSHPTGVALGAVLFGAAPMSVVGLIILLFQALLLAHGGLTTLGANVFSMAVVGPFVAYYTFKFLKDRFGGSVAIFFAAFLGDIITYVVTSIQLSMAFPDATGGIMASFIKFAGIFALTQLPLAVSEGLLTVIVYGVLVKYSGKELSALGALPKQHGGVA